MLESVVHLLLFFLQLFLLVLAFGAFGLLGQFALLFGQTIHLLNCLFHFLFHLQTLHQLDVLVQLLLELCIVHLKLFQLLLHLLLVHLLHHTLYLGHRLLHLLIHHLVHQAVQFPLLLYKLFALFAIFLLQTVVLLNLLLHLLHHLAHLLLFLGNLLQLLFILPVELLLVHQPTHHIVYFLLQLLQLAHLHLGTLAHIAATLFQHAVELFLRRNLYLKLLRTGCLGAMDGIVVAHLEPIGQLVARGQHQLGRVEREEELLRRLPVKGNFSLADGVSGRVRGIDRPMHKNKPCEAVIIFYTTMKQPTVGMQRINQLVDHYQRHRIGYRCEGILQRVGQMRNA